MMQIRTQYQPSFGYDKKANDRLKSQLEKNESANIKGTIEYNLLNLQSICNVTEERIEFVGADSSERELSFFTQAKSLLIDLVETYYPDLGFADKEIQHYRERGDKKEASGVEYGDNWEKQLADEVDVWGENPFAEQNDLAGTDFKPGRLN